MSIAIGGNSVSKMYVGSTEITKAYIGDTLVYGGTQPTIPNYLRFVALEASTIGVTSTLGAFPDLRYSFDLSTWTAFTNNSPVSMSEGQIMYIKGINTAFGTSTSVYTKFVMTGTIEAHGNIMSLLYGDNFEGQLVIPASYCFILLFYQCASLVTAPDLPATTLTERCYYGLFQQCTGLVQPPALPSSTLAPRCYYNMFYGCSALTQAPELPATTMVEYCYTAMFRNCINLTTAPVLPALTLVNRCYNTMFAGCTKLNYIKAMFTTTPGTSYSNSWVNGVSATGTFVKNSAAKWNVTGNNGIPSGWTVQTASS